MTDCQAWLNELAHPAEIVLDEDLAALQHMPDRSRVDRYADLRSNEEELLWEFCKEHPDFLTDSERDRIRGEMRLARLLIAASFYAEGSVPAELQDDFVEAELQAVVDFDRYKQFDALDSDQIEERIRRMDGEVYELVQEYTSTQIANVDELVDDPDVQQDVIERLLERYEDRRERIREGFFVYVETHGLEHMIEAIEEAVGAVAEASHERERVREAVREELEAVEMSLEEGFRTQRQELELRLDRVERNLASETVDVETIRDELAAGGVDDEALEELRAAIERTRQLESTLDEKIEELESAKAAATEADREQAREATAEIVDDELERLTEQRSEIRAEIDRLRREREGIESASDRLAERQRSLEDRVEDVATSVEADGGIDGADAVTSSTARLFEMDYLGRFDTTMHELDELSLPDGTREIPDGYWDGRSERRNDTSRMIQLLDDNDGGRVETYPTNPTARYEVTTKRYLGLSDETEMIIEATVFSHLEAHAVNGFDASPAGVDDLLALVNDAVREADREDVAYLLGIASPTGWTDRVQQQLVDDDTARTRYSRRVGVCLIDLRDGELIYDGSDPLVADNAAIFERALDAERVDDCIVTVRSEYLDDIGRDTVTLAEVVDQHGFDRHVVKQTFEHLESEGAGEQFYVDEQGLTLHAA